MVFKEDTMSEKTKVPVLTDGLHIDVEICPEITILRICNEKNQQFAYISLDINENYVRGLEHSLNLSNFNVFDNLQKRKAMQGK